MRRMKCWIACQSYFIVLTVRTHDVQNHDRLEWLLNRISSFSQSVHMTYETMTELNGFSIVFYRSRSPYTRRTKPWQPTASVGRAWGASEPRLAPISSVYNHWWKLKQKWHPQIIMHTPLGHCSNYNFLRTAIIWGWLLSEGAYYLIVATTGGWLLFDSGYYLRVATIW